MSQRRDEDAAAQAAAGAAAAAAGVAVEGLDAMDDLHAVARLFTAVWETEADEAPMAAHLLRALAHTGNYVAGARRGGVLVGASVGFLAATDGLPTLHSHISAVAPAARDRSVGYAMKLHQRAWALARGIGAITWTFDPLVRRNAYFNLTKLGARAVAYHADFYGAMAGINAGDPSDRLMIEWSVAAPLPAASVRAHDDADLVKDGAVIVLAEGDNGAPVGASAAPAPGVRLCRLPADIVALRHARPDVAGAWRLAVRAVLGAALQEGYAATAVTRSGSYVLEPAGPR